MEIPYDNTWKNIIVEHIRSILERSSSKGVVMGISGGLDSALTMALAAEALGGQAVIALLLPSACTPDEDMEHARSHALSLGVKTMEIGIDNILCALKNADAGRGKMAEANLHSRVRMLLLYQAANAHSLLVLGTSNKTELMTGYFTKYGDGASDMCPLGDLYKTQVRRMAREMGVPDVILGKTPSAGLPGVGGDEEELGYSYDILDKVLYSFEFGWDDGRVAEETGVAVLDVQKIRGMVQRSRHKRGLGMIPKIGIRTVGLDLREDPCW